LLLPLTTQTVAYLASELAAKRISVADDGPLRLLEEFGMREKLTEVVNETGEVKPFVFFAGIGRSQRLCSFGYSSPPRAI
jgi:hypothetical protein